LARGLVEVEDHMLLSDAQAELRRNEKTLPASSAGIEKVVFVTVVFLGYALAFAAFVYPLYMY
jgi:hypothetical protein